MISYSHYFYSNLHIIDNSFYVDVDRDIFECGACRKQWLTKAGKCGRQLSYTKAPQTNNDMMAL